MRILKQANQTITEACLKSLRQEGEPVKLKPFKNSKWNFFTRHVEVQLIERIQLILFLILKNNSKCIIY